MRKVNIKHHVKSGSSSLKIELVMINCPNRSRWSGQSVRYNPKYRAVFSANNKCHSLVIYPTAYLVSIRLIIYICSHSSLFLLLLLLSLWLYTIGICRWNNHIPTGSAFRLLFDPPISVLQGYSSYKFYRYLCSLDCLIKCYFLSSS